MKFLLAFPLSGAFLWEFSFPLLGFYLILHPALAHSQSYAVALGGGFLLLLFRSVGEEALEFMGKAWWLFLVLLLASSLWSLSPGVTFQSAGFIFLGTLLYLQARSLEWPSKGRILAAGLFLACLTSFSALEQWRSGFQEIASRLSELPQEDLAVSTAWAYNKRASGFLVNPAALGALMIFFIPIGAVLFWISSGTKKIIYGFVAVLLALGLLAAKSVGACVCLTLAVLAVYFGREFVIRPKGSSKVWPLIVLAAGAAAVFALVWERGLQSWLLASFSVRLELWNSAWTLFLQHPWIGSGFGTFDEAYQLAGLSQTTGSRFAHNLFFQLMVETGATGVLFFLGALIGFVRRLKAPVRWEGWGVLTGLLAVFFFSMLDIPFQMPELVWIFAGTLGLLEFRPEKRMFFPPLPAAWMEYGLLAVLLAVGFLPPYSALGFCLLGGALWGLAAYFQRGFDQTPLWVSLGAIYLTLMAFVSPSALGAARFLGMSGLILAFFLVLPCFRDPMRFLKFFWALGLVWALKVWWISIQGAKSFGDWVSFQYSDMKGFMLFHNPKQVAVFLIPLIFLLGLKPRGALGFAMAAFSFLTMIRLKSMAVLLGLSAGLLSLLKPKYRVWAGISSLVLVLGLGFLRSLDPSPTKWGRFEIWSSAVKVWASSPWVGIGPGAFAGHYQRVKEPRVEGVSRYLMDAQVAHSEFLEWLAAFGLIGLVFGSWVLWTFWRRSRDPVRRPALAALSAASLVDFVLHNPMIAFQGAGLLAPLDKARRGSSWPGAILAVGMVLGLFGSALFAGQLIAKSQQLVQDGNWKDARQPLASAERLNAWDARVVVAKADYFERLYFATKDPVWGRLSDETFLRAMALEKADGQMALLRAERLMGALSINPSPEKIQEVRKAWGGAEKALPVNAFAYFGEGLFYWKLALRSGEAWGKDGRYALRSFQKAVELEPNFASAWMYLGLCRKEQRMESPARWDFEMALQVHDRWKNVERVDALEKRLVSLNREELRFLEKEVAP